MYTEKPFEIHEKICILEKCHPTYNMIDIGSIIPQCVEGSKAPVMVYVTTSQVIIPQTGSYTIVRKL